MKSKSQQVFDYIEQKIMAGEFQAGQKIPSEKKLGQSLGVSRVSVRSGIGKLIAIGLLTKEKHGPTYVAANDQDNFLKMMTPAFVHNFNYLEMLEIRKALDALTVELCITHMDQAVIDELRQLLAEMAADQGQGDFFALDRNYHLTISKHSCNRLLHNINELIWEVLERTSRDQYHAIGNKERVLEHQRILDAIIQSDYELAKLFSIRHLERTIKAIGKGKNGP